MGYKSTPSLKHQIKQRFDTMMAIGVSRHADKRQEKERGDITSTKIYSWSTRHGYDQAMFNFSSWVRDNYKIKEIDKMKPFLQPYVDHLIKEGQSPYTQAKVISAASKYFQEKLVDTITHEKEERSKIVRSREAVANDIHFSEEKNEELINFCRHTGLRRRELETLRGGSIVKHDDGYYVIIYNGKGGKEREAKILDDDKRVIDRIANTPKDEKVWKRVHSHADIHSYRADYANDFYNKIARDVKALPYKEVYHCHKDKAGIWYDKWAMGVVSKSLGHEQDRHDVIASNYLR